MIQTEQFKQTPWGPVKGKRVALCLLGVALVECGCGEGGARRYRVSKKIPAGVVPVQAVAPGGPAAGLKPLGSAPSNRPDYLLEVPSNWVRQSPKPMQLERFFIPDLPGVEANLSAFQGDTGGLWANVNRWRGQLGLSSLPAGLPVEELPGVTMRVLGGEEEVPTVALEGGGRAIRVILYSRRDWSWFFKLEGPVKGVQAAEAVFESWAASFRLDSPQSEAGQR